MFMKPRDNTAKNINGVSYFLTGVNQNLQDKSFKEIINIPTNFWTAVCYDTSGAPVTYKNRFKGWSFVYPAYSAANLNSEKPLIIDIFPIEEFLKTGSIVSIYHKLFKDIVVANGNKQPLIVRNCLYYSRILVPTFPFTNIDKVNQSTIIMIIRKIIFAYNTDPQI